MGRPASELSRAEGRLRNKFLATLDASMPRLDGLGVIRRLRADPATARLPIILVTGSGEEANRARGLDLSVDACLVKPIRINELVASVRAHARR